MSSFELFCHPATPCASITQIQVELVQIDNALKLEYQLLGNINGLIFPTPTRPSFRDGLWRHTCMEAFLMERAGSGRYLEVNFAPSTEWAIYSFDAYRVGMEAVQTIQPPVIAVSRQQDLYQMSVSMKLEGLGIATEPSNLQLALSAVIEEHNGVLSYWAGIHRPDKPDFHHPDNFCFQLTC